MRGALSSRVGAAAADVDLAVAGSQLDHAAQLGGKLHASGAAADDGNVDISALDKAAHHLRAHPSVESVRLILAVDEVAVFEDTGRAKVVGAAAEGQDQHVVVQFAGAGDHFAGRTHRRQADASLYAVDAIELPGDVFEMMRARMRHVLHCCS